MSLITKIAACGLIVWAATSRAVEPFDAAAAFGARSTIADVSLSPDGKSLAYLRPLNGQGSALYTVAVAGGQALPALTASGNPERLDGCHWVSNERLICVVYGVVRNPSVGLLPFTRLIAVDRTGANLQILSNSSNEYTRGYLLNGGSVIDWLPDQNNAVLMTRAYLPDQHLGSRTGSERDGLAVDELDSRTMQVRSVEPALKNATSYISDGRGTVRIMGRSSTVAGDQDSGIYRYFYRKQTSREWEKLSEYRSVDGQGFRPIAIDYDLNIAYGLQKKDGRAVLYSVALDGTLTSTVVYERSDVDIDGLVQIGRRNRVVGATYVTAKREAVYFDQGIDRLMRSLSKALPDQPKISIVDSNVDESVLLVYAGSDDDPGLYYVYTRASKELHIVLVSRPQLEGVKLAKVTPIAYPATDGELIPAYLTLPPGVVSAKGLPAIVLPHGGPSARDEWGFDWLSQFYAARGFVVIQPNFRGSAGYGDAWLHDNGFKSWRTAIGDVLDAGHWLIGQGIADPAKICVVGWSYGGYAALQAAVVEPSLFKAVVAIAPVTDLAELKAEHRHWSNYELISREIGEGPHIREGSPSMNAQRIKAPVLLFHGTSDRNVSVDQSRRMADRLEKAGVKHELVVWDNLDHYLEDSTARTTMLRRSADFLYQAIGGEPSAASLSSSAINVP